jgi:phage major head subunit gpT-like protein
MSRSGSAGSSGAPDAPSGEEVVQAALCLQAGMPNVEKYFDDRTLNAADKMRKTISLSEVLVRAAKSNGYSGSDRLSSGNLGQVLQASFATHQFGNLLSAVVNKNLLSGFNAVENTWQEICSVGSVNDFKAVNLFRLNGSFKFQKVGAAGELKSAGSSATDRSVSADTYGITTSLTRQDLINDDLSALSKIPQRIGRGAALSLNEVIWAEFESGNAGFYQSITAGAGNALSLTSLKAAQTAWRKLKDPDGNPLGMAARNLLVPPDQEITALELMTSSVLIADGVGNSASKTPAQNVLRGKYNVIVSNYLTSASTWWLTADKADLAPLEVVFLNGQQVPTVEQVAADFQMLGVQMRGWMDFGVAKGEALAALGMRTS